jgi:2-methylcitrate dehydratase PrpD
MGPIDTLTKIVQETTFAELPPPAIERAKRAILDATGVGLYGVAHPIGKRVTPYVDTALSGNQATVFAHGTASVEGAALANGTFAHALDYDDAFETIRIHPTVATFPAALAAAEYEDTTGQDLLTGYVVGVEVAYRVGHSIYPGHYEHGFHSTGTMGTFGATAAVASVFDLSAQEIQHALGIAASSSSALKRNFGSMTKALHAGHAAGTGVRAGLLAREGFTASESVFDGDGGYGAVMAPTYDPDAITADVDSSWAVTEIGYKLYPSRRNTHGMMEALRRVVERENLTLDDVARVSVTLDDNAAMVPNYPVPADEMEAKYSIEFCAAAVLRERTPGVEAFTDDYVTAPETRAAIELVESGFDDLVGDGFSGWGARVHVETVGGRELTEEERGAVGHADRIDPARLRKKFYDCSETTLRESLVSTVESSIDVLDEPGALARLTEALEGQ